MKFFVFLLFLISFINAKDSLLIKQKNALYVQNLIKIEEEIAFNYEKYLLTEFKIPTLINLISNDYLGSNFSVRNILGSDIQFKDVSNLKIKFAITADTEPYVTSLYKRDLYRDRTTVYIPSSDSFDNAYINSYSLIELQTNEAKNIYNLLKAGFIIGKDCSTIVVNTYCNKNITSLRWYNIDSNWIEYSKKDFNNANVTVKNKGLLTDTKLSDLAVGSYIYIENGDKYLKVVGTTLSDQIKKVN